MWRDLLNRANISRDLGLHAKSQSQESEEFYTSAIEDYNSALDSALEVEQHWEIYYNQAVAYFDMGNISDAIDCIDKAFILNSKYKPICVLRDSLLSKKG